MAGLIASPEFAARARHPDHPNAFTRQRSLPLPALVAALLTMRGGSQQTLLDGFFGALAGSIQFVRGVSDRAFAQARARLHMPALSWLNDQLLARLQTLAPVSRWQGLRVVAGDASVLMPARRACHRTRGLADSDQRLFALYLPAAELTLHAAVHSARVSERAMLAEALDCLAPDDLLVLDRGYPAAWLARLLQDRGQRFVMRCDSTSGFAVVRQFMRSGQAERVVQLPAPSARDCADWACSRQPTQVRLVRHTAPGGQMRVLMTNVERNIAAAADFAALYHQRWRIEEAFKRLKHRMKLESASGLSQQALLIDVAAKVLADNLASLLCAAAASQADLAATSQRCNRSYAADLTARLLAPVLLALGDVAKAIGDALDLLSCTTQKYIPGRSRPRPTHTVKPHPSVVYKG